MNTCPPGLAEALDAFEATLLPAVRLNATHDDETAVRVAASLRHEFAKARDVALGLMRIWRLRAVSHRGTWYIDVRVCFSLDGQADREDILAAIRPHQRARVRPARINI